MVAVAQDQLTSALYKNAPDAERDACGIGSVAHIEGHKSDSLLCMALESLGNHAHRGAIAVVEGVDEHGREYMTDGEALVCDLSGNLECLYNSELIRIRRRPNGVPENGLKDLVRTHVEKIGFPRGSQIVKDWPVQGQAIWHVTPQEGVEAMEARNEGMRMFEKEEQLKSSIPAESRAERKFPGFFTR